MHYTSVKKLKIIYLFIYELILNVVGLHIWHVLSNFQFQEYLFFIPTPAGLHTFLPCMCPHRTLFQGHMKWLFLNPLVQIHSFALHDEISVIYKQSTHCLFAIDVVLVMTYTELSLVQEIYDRRNTSKTSLAIDRESSTLSTQPLNTANYCIPDTGPDSEPVRTHTAHFCKIHLSVKIPFPFWIFKMAAFKEVFASKIKKLEQQ